MMRALSHRPLLVTVVVGLLLFAVGVAVGWNVEQLSPEYESVRETSTDYRFIAPLLFVKVPEESSFPEYAPLKQTMSNVVDSSISAGKVTSMAVYFRNLNTSQWVGVNVEERFSPASMLKVLTLLGVFRESERNPNLLSTRITLTAPQDGAVVGQDAYPPRNPVLLGNAYSVSELVERLVVDSDNLANYALNKLVGQEQVMRVYDDLQLPRPDSAGERGYTAQEYSRLFRTLYNGTYLSRDTSERVLAILSRTNFTQGIVAGVPSGTIVAHKFGVRTGTPPFELHDCGIVYYPEHPYFLCIMTRGNDFAVLESVLTRVSQLVWREVDSLH